jgi:hypothetical protein
LSIQILHLSAELLLMPTFRYSATHLVQMLTSVLKVQGKKFAGSYMPVDKATLIILMVIMKEFLTQGLQVGMQKEYLVTATIGAIQIYLIHFLITSTELLRKQN